MSQAALDFDFHPFDRDVAFELGWDHAHHGVTPPVEHLAMGSPLRHGWDAGRASFGKRTLAANRHVRKWLQLRLNAWRRGRAFEGVQVTPHYLRQIDATHCPVTREPLTHGSGEGSDASIDRVRNDAGYAAGNLAVMSARANAAKDGMGFDEALAAMRCAEAGGEPAEGLDAAQWARVAVLCSFVTELPHEQACGLPLLVLPPNRLRLFNPVQALQTIVTRQFGREGWSGRVARLEALLPGKPLRRDFQRFVHALLPRVIEAGRGHAPPTLAWALEDAWRNPLVLRCWTRFARQLTPAQAEAIALRAGAQRLGGAALQPLTIGQATEGWALERGGYEANGRPAGPWPAPATASGRRGAHSMGVGTLPMMPMRQVLCTYAALRP